MGLPPFASAADRAACERFFRDRPAARASFEALRKAAGGFGPVQVVGTKSRVAFLARTRFLWCPEAHVDGTLDVAFHLPHPLPSLRLRSGAVGNKWSHHVHLRELDAEALAWFREAYAWDTGRLGAP
jgi:hypothetical protein